MEKLGKLKICDICGASIFMPKIPKKFAVYNENEVSSADRFEIPWTKENEWRHWTGIGDVCPNCQKIIVNKVNEYMKNTGKEEIVNDAASEHEVNEAVTELFENLEACMAEMNERKEKQWEQ